ncbi:hypothetical protein M378DRAFT_369589 [Amanita muscaria Koide BX008]|uniref:Extracellular membrane protein CFEM domain-containing protein n=1 Tax=Amanita muscaria (strain Koide BX008) TaxID=946122 RepID=A0A0C2WXQ6_AMAMK|nr:hypothetical protein M378DRAFT_369589 [Amanita muscaria Koide BX008]
MRIPIVSLSLFAASIAAASSISSRDFGFPGKRDSSLFALQPLQWFTQIMEQIGCVKSCVSTAKNEGCNSAQCVCKNTHFFSCVQYASCSVQFLIVLEQICPNLQ